MISAYQIPTSRPARSRFVGATLAGAILATLLAAGNARAQDLIELAQSPFNSRAAVPPLLLLAIDPGPDLLASAWPGSYDPERPHEGYFDHRKCYRHDARNDLFVIDSDANNLHSCARNRSTYSGNFLNWASMTMLDTLRYALTGGKRVIDTPGETVLQRADTGDPDDRLDGGSDSLHKSVSGDEVDIRRQTPFNVSTIHMLSCGRRLLLADRAFADGCSGRVRGGRLLADLELRVRVCDGVADRRRFCIQDRFNKPHGELQRVAHWLRIGLLTGSTASAPQSSARFIGPSGNALDDPGQPNDQAEWNPESGVARTSGGARDGVLKQLNELSPRTKGGNGEVYRKTIAWLEVGGDPGTVTASCQNNTVLHIGALSAQSNGGSSKLQAAADWTHRILSLETDAGGTRGNPSPSTTALADPRSDAVQLAALAYRANLGRESAAGTGATTIAIEFDNRVDDNRGDNGGDAYPNQAPPDAPQGSPLFLLAAKYGGFDDVNRDGNPFTTSLPAMVRWNQPGQIEWDRNDDGVADGYHRAADGEQLLQAVRNAFRQIERSRNQHIAPADVAVGQVHRGNLYLAAYEARTWSGAIRRYAVTHTGQAGVARADEPVWESSMPQPEQRKLITSARDATGRAIAVPLEWSRLTQPQQAQLDTSAETGQPDGLGRQRIAWLHGERQTEEGSGGVLRRRWAPLGDVVNSNLVFSVDEPAVLFAGANDGLLHAFDVSTGRELFAWLPATLLPLLPELTAPIYPHRALLDGGLDVGKLDLGGASRTVLAGSYGRGARGVFALDVTNPAAFGKESGPLFEFGVAEDAAIGHVLGAPRVVNIAVETASNKSAPQSAAQRPFVLAEAGVNAPAGLYLIALDKPASEPWRKGVNWFRIGVAPEPAATARHLAAPALVLAEDGSLAHAWAGDMGGNLWRFSFKPDRKAATGFKVETSLLFQARAADGSPQPITSAPRIAYANDGGYIVSFGTGKLLEHRDLAPAAGRIESVYSIHDRVVAEPAIKRSSLAVRKIETSDDSGVRVTGDAFSYNDHVRGWVVDLPPGERVIATPALAGGRLYAMALRIPDQPCHAIGSWVWNVDVLTGLSDTAVVNGSSGQATLRVPLVFEIANPAGWRDALGRWNGGRLHAILFQDPGTGGSGSAATRADTTPAGRLSWKEIVNWQQIRDEARGK